MKHILTLLFCASAITASAQSYDFLTFQKVQEQKLHCVQTM